MDASTASPTVQSETANKMMEYVVELIFGHKKLDLNISYLVAWYVYTAADNAVKSERHIPMHSISVK